MNGLAGLFYVTNWDVLVDMTPVYQMKNNLLFTLQPFSLYGN